jgi:glycosyltransferase involved in cell wall biosynthesis
MPTFSIITPSLNQARYLARMLESLESQEFADFEHIVIDGGSTDGSLEVLRAFESRYNLRWSSQPDAGMYDAINSGLREAKGEILAYLNTDDTYYPWTLRVARNEFEERPQAGLIYGDISFFDEESGRGSVLLYPKVDEVMMERAVVIAQPATFWRREVLELTGEFDATLRGAGDLDYWLRVASVAPMEKVDEVLAADSRRPDALRVRYSQEYGLVRRRYWKERGVPRTAKFRYQSLRYHALGQVQIFRFTAQVIRDRLGLSVGRNWREFIRALGHDISLFRLILANVPTRQRLQGLGLLARPAVPGG